MEVVKFNPDKVFFTSDTHFGHESILRFCDRPFGSKEEMNETLISNWNNIVPHDGIVFHLGDFIFGGAGLYKDIIQKLNGNIRLVIGNHDINALRQGFYKYFESVNQQELIQVGNSTIYLNHYPMLTYAGIYKENNPWIQCFGHVHLSKYKNIGKDFDRLKFLLPTQYDVGVDLNYFSPISFNKLKQRIDYQVENNLNCTYWIDHD